jgi:hypothetical protein
MAQGRLTQEFGHWKDCDCTCFQTLSSYKVSEIDCGYLKCDYV